MAQRKAAPEEDLSRRERQIMDVLLRRRQATASVVRAALALLKNSDLHMNDKVLSRLEQTIAKFERSYPAEENAFVSPEYK